MVCLTIILVSGGRFSQAVCLLLLWSLGLDVMRMYVAVLVLTIILA